MAPLHQNKHYGQYFTKRGLWLRPHIAKFIKSSGCGIAYDPFAGNGDLLAAVKKLGFKKFVGLDIDRHFKWEHNDSLIDIPRIENSIIITNPPYLTNYSAKRKKIFEHVSIYFDNCKYDDLYQLAIEKSLQNDMGVMIVPETFINSSFPKDRLRSITILEDNPFDDTENPVCVICFDKDSKPYSQIKIYKNDAFLGTLDYFEKLRLKPNNSFNIKFNDISGKVALRAVDTTNPKKLIRFMKKSEIDYDLKGIKHSSRLITIINVPVGDDKLDKFIHHSNTIFKEFREKTQDILLSPFKGNRKDNKRRRRLDYQTARAILEMACARIYNQSLYGQN